MNAFELLKIANDCRVKIGLAGCEHISVEPVDRLPAGVLEQLAQHKQDIIACLSQQVGQQHQTSQSIAGNDLALDYVPATHRRALNGFYWLLAQQRERLSKRGYPVHDALLKPGVWREQLIKILGLTPQQAMQIERDLIKRGLLAYDSYLNNYLVVGDGVPPDSNQSQPNSEGCYLPAGNTGQDFLNWLYGHDDL
jgi:hypothetical protein